MPKTIQDYLAKKIISYYPDAEVKKINKDNHLDIHLPQVHPMRGTHLFFNTARGVIKVGFYCRDEEFVQQKLIKSSAVEAYSQGIRPKGNPEWKSKEEALTAALAFIEVVSGKENSKAEEPVKKPVQKSVSIKAIQNDNENKSTDLDLNSFDVSKFDLEGNPSPNILSVPKGKPADPSLADETDRCLDDPLPFLISLQLIRNYYLLLSSESNAYRTFYENILREFSQAAVVPRIKDEVFRISYEGGKSLEGLMIGSMLQAEDIYDRKYDTHIDYILSLGKIVTELLKHCNTGLFLDTLEFFMYLGDALDEENSPTGSLNAQDRYFILFLMLKVSPAQHLDNLKMVLSKGENSRNTISLVDVKNLVLKASGNFNQLSAEEKLALILYDFILWDEKPGLDIKLSDIAAAKTIFQTVTQNSAQGDQLLGGFEDNFSFEVFQFFNIELNRDGFHDFCLERWKELSSEWNQLKLQLLIEGVRRDFHPDTYKNNPVLDDYLKIYRGVKVDNLTTPSDPAIE